MMKRSHAVIGAAAGVAVAHATGASMVAGGIVAALAGLLPDLDHPHAAVGRLLPAGGTGSPLPRPSACVGDLGSRRLRADGAGLTRATPGAGFSVQRGLPGPAGS
jgi:hypothetical protein